jgi:hypothetical protein
MISYYMRSNPGGDLKMNHKDKLAQGFFGTVAFSEYPAFFRMMV